VILIDANLLIYAIDSNAPQHKRARPWLERVLSGADPVGLPWIVILAFIRITTREGIMRRPLSLAAALAYVQSWLRQPCVEAVGARASITGRSSAACSRPPARPAISRPTPTSRPWRWSAAPRSAPPITTLPASRAFGESTR
jgi:toxin-antitoxin system PIN domain toxin